MKWGRRSKGDAWWWNEEVKEVVLIKKIAHKSISNNITDGNWYMHKGVNTKAKIMVLRAIR